jgi:predicted secreted protein
MGIVTGIVLFAVVWFMVLFVVLPIRLETQGDVGERVEGTHAGSPATGFSMKKRVRLTTLWAIPIWAIIAGVLVFGDISVRDIDIFGRMGPASDQ